MQPSNTTSTSKDTGGDMPDNPWDDAVHLYNRESCLLSLHLSVQPVSEESGD